MSLEPEKFGHEGLTRREHYHLTVTLPTGQAMEPAEYEEYESTISELAQLIIAKLGDEKIKNPSQVKIYWKKVELLPDQKLCDIRIDGEVIPLYNGTKRGDIQVVFKKNIPSNAQETLKGS